MLHNTLTNANDLQTWADRLPARSQLPRLIRRLVYSTTKDAQRIEFPADEAIQLGGWDGIVEIAAGNDRVPTGISVWELGVNVNPKSKADEDYQKRTQNPLGVNPSETTFVFITLRRWGGKEDWVQARQAEGIWREVRAYDADDLAAWLEQTPAVHIWISQLIGRIPEGAASLDTFWKEWSQETNPALTPALAIGGREAQKEEVLCWLGGEPGRLLIQGDSEQEVLAFLAATIESSGTKECKAAQARAVVVDDAASWRTLAMSSTPLILIPRFGIPEGINVAVQQGHHVCLIQRRATTTDGITLPRLNRAAVEQALLDTGLSHDKAQTLATLARRSLSAFRRKLSVITVPSWAEPLAATAILAPLLAGTWENSREADQSVLARLAGKPYSDIQREIVRWANEPDSPLRQVAGIWMIAAHEDAWRLLAPFLTHEDVARFEEVAIDVLSERNPAFDLPQDKRWAANLYGKNIKYSARLREGIAETLALMAALSNEVTLVDALPSADVAQRVVRILMEKAKGSPDLWASFAYQLPLLAEAAPNVFLDAVDEGLRGSNPFLRDVFQDTQDAGLFASSPHTGLLWALETLAWHADYLGRAALCLAALAQIDPGGKLVNRPSRSLRDIFLMWQPHTAALLSKRLAVLDAIRKRYPNVAWALLVSVLPDNHSSVSPTHKPQWRDWVPEERAAISMQEYADSTSLVLERLLSDAGAGAAQWINLIKRCDSLFPHQREVLLQRLESLEISLLTSEDKTLMRDKLREVVSHHRRFPEAQWVMPTEHLDRLENVYGILEPDDPFYLHRWLFRRRVDIPGIRETEWEERMDKLDTLRGNALQAIVAAAGFDGVYQIAQHAEDAAIVGEALARSEILADNEDGFLECNLANNDALRARVATGVVSGGSWKFGQSWVDARLSAAQIAGWSAEQWGDFLVAVPFNFLSLDNIDQLPELAQKLFWERLNFIPIPKDPAEGERILSRLIHFGNPAAMLDVVERAQSQIPGMFPPARIADLLEACVTTTPPSGTDWQTFGHVTAELLTALENSDLPKERLVKLEWMYMAIHEHYRHPKILHGILAEEPKSFVDILQYVYLPSQDGDERDSENIESGAEEAKSQARVAELAYNLLNRWHVLPGRQEDGGVDEQALRNWVLTVRELAGECHRLKVADIHIGHALAFSPPDADGAWPHQAVRNMVEELANPEIEQGCQTQIRNNRGVTSRLPTDGGAQERELAARYSKYAEAVDGMWPRTASMLRAMADSYLHDAKREDSNAELMEDFWR